MESALFLLVLGVFADNHDFSFSFDDLALIADLFDGRFYFHCYNTVPFSVYFFLQVMRPLVRS